MPFTPSFPVRAIVAATLMSALSLAPIAPAMAQTQPKPPATSSAPIRQSTYVLGFGDSINMQVVQNEKLNVVAQPIRPDGRISIPLLGEVQAGGLTVQQFQTQLTKSFGKYFVDPQVAVNVAEFRPLRVSVFGKVEKPNTFTVAEPVRLLEALSLAGGPDPERANLSNVLVLRPSGERLVIDVNAVLEGKTDDNVWLYDGDVVRIEEVSGPDLYRILPPLASIVSVFGTMIVVYLNTQRR